MILHAAERLQGKIDNLVEMLLIQMNQRDTPPYTSLNMSVNPRVLCDGDPKIFEIATCSTFGGL